ncbi:MAG: DNA gyrase subunit A [Lentisphaeria bacterium]|nr:DNA gyrase subunit A [Lentisphaeria bacterium]
MDDDTKAKLSESDYPVNIEELMHTAYLQYSLSVNVGRAIPDVRDGLKPVARRILYAMRMLGLSHTHSFTKCAQVVGEVMGKYHPHGDSAIYDTLVRMAQDFSMRHPLIWGQGNFGSIDGDPPAAYRYTECRMQRLAEELLVDLEKDTVDMVANYDDKLTEPSVLPAKFPNLLVNGATGIGVGMATNIPPHNLGEVIDATVHLIDNPSSNVEDLMQFVQGPDFPTGASIMGLRNLRTLYETGKASMTVRGKCHIEETKEGAEKIIITEIPYMLNKESLVLKIADLVNNKVITGISNLQDLSSSRVGIKIEIQIKRNAMASVVLNQLYKHSQLQTFFAAQFLVIDHNRPRTMNLVEILQAYVDHREEVVTRRTQHELMKAEARAHVLEGLLIAVDNIDEIIAMIRASRDRDEASAKLMARFDFTKRQTSAILDMRLNQLTGLAREQLQAEFDELQERIAYFKELLSNRPMLMGVIKEELAEVRNRYAEDRRTEIQAAEDDISIEDLIKRSICTVTVSNTGYVKRLAMENFRAQRRGGKGVRGMQTKEDDFVQHLFTACTHDYLMFFTSAGQMHWMKVYEIPEGGRQSKGKALINFFEIGADEEVRSLVTVEQVDDESKALVFCTRKGIVKKTNLAEFKHLRRKGIRAIKLDEDDQLIDVQLINEDQEVILYSAYGMACRFENSQVRSMGRSTRGVTGMRLKSEDDEIVAMTIVNKGDDIINITESGMGKRSNIGAGIAEIDQGAGYRLTNRGGKGVTSIKLKEGDRLAGALVITDEDEVMVTTESGQIVRFKCSEIRAIGRSSQGVKVMNLKGSDKIISVAKIATMEEDEDDEESDEEVNAEAVETVEANAESGDAAKESPLAEELEDSEEE